MSQPCTFQAAFPYQKDVLALPVTDISAAADWYGKNFQMREVERIEDPVLTVVMERDGVRLGFAVNGGDAENDGAAILVSGIDSLQKELETRGVSVGNRRIDERDGNSFHVFFVVAPDGLCYYFHEPV